MIHVAARSKSIAKERDIPEDICIAVMVQGARGDGRCGVSGSYSRWGHANVGYLAWSRRSNVDENRKAMSVGGRPRPVTHRQAAAGSDRPFGVIRYSFGERPNGREAVFRPSGRGVVPRRIWAVLMTWQSGCNARTTNVRALKRRGSVGRNGKLIGELSLMQAGRSA